MPTSRSLENPGYCRVPLRWHSSRRNRHHCRVSSALLSPASEIRPRQHWVSGEVPSLRGCYWQRSAAVRGTHVQQHPPWQRAHCSRHPDTGPCQHPPSRAAPQNQILYLDGHMPSGVRQQGVTGATRTSPQPPAILDAHEVGSAVTDHAISPHASPQCPLGRDRHASGCWPYLVLALGVAGELAACGREKGERVSGSGMGALPGVSPQAPHVGGRTRGGKPCCGTWSTLAPGTDHHDVHMHTWMPTPCTLACAHTGWHQHCTAPCAHACGTWHTPHAHKLTLPRANVPGSVHTCRCQCLGVNGVKGGHARTRLMKPRTYTSMQWSTMGCQQCLCPRLPMRCCCTLIPAPLQRIACAHMSV